MDYNIFCGILNRQIFDNSWNESLNSSALLALRPEKPNLIARKRLGCGTPADAQSFEQGLELVRVIQAVAP
jgi:hypothetical protein